MLEALAEWMCYPLYYAFDGASPPARTGASHATIYPYGLFPTGDGKTVLLGLQNEREWVSFCDDGAGTSGTRRPRSVSPAMRARNANRDGTAGDHRRRFSGPDRRRGHRTAGAARIANARANDMHEVWEHPQLEARDRWRQVDTPAGAVPALLPPGSWDQEGPRMDPVPALGAHTDAILAELGLGASDVAALRSAGAV